jgi:hypothetical protein
MNLTAKGVADRAGIAHLTLARGARSVNADVTLPAQ